MRADHGVKRYFIGPAKHHYRNYNVYIPVTKGERTTDTIEFFPQHVQTPQISSEDRLASATKNLVKILQKSHPPTPFLDQGTKTNDAIQDLQKRFQPRQRDNTKPTRVQDTATRVNARLPTIDKNAILVLNNTSSPTDIQLCRVWPVVQVLNPSDFSFCTRVATNC